MKHYINGIEVTPRNIGEIGIRCSFTERMQDIVLNVDSITLTREDYELVKQHTSNIGVFEGIPYTVVMNSGIQLEYFINLTEKTIYRTYEVECKIMLRKSIDKFFDDASGSSFELIKSKGFTFPIFDIPYVIIKDNQLEIAIPLTITLFLMIKELADATRQLVMDTVDLIGATTPNLGTGFSMDTGDIISKVLKIIAQIVYIALLLSSIVMMGKQLQELIFPKVRYLKGCKVKDLLTVGCNFLGYNFSSTCLNSYSGLTILPVPLQKQVKKFFMFKQNSLNLSFNKGYPTANDSTPTVGSLLEEMCKFFNGRIRVINGTVHLERRDYWASVTSNQIAPALALQDSRQDEYTYNTDDAWKRYVIGYTPDISDLHTFDNFEGNDCELSCEPINVVNADLVTVKGLVDVVLPFALGSRKEKLNWLEELAKAVFKVIDSVIIKLGGNSSLSATIQNRIGVLKISQQYFSITKLMYTNGGRQPVNYLSYIGAINVYNNFHKINQIELNGQKIRNNVRARFNDSDFLSLISNNFANIDGDICEITELTYIEDSHSVEITYREPDNYASGKVKTVVINS